MRIANKKAIIISFLNTILSDKNDNYYMISPELTGCCETNVGGGKKKYQYLKGDICISYDSLNKENQKNHNVIMSILNNHMIYAFLKKEYASDETKKLVKDSDKDLNNFLSKNPKVEQLLDELLDTLKAANYN